MKSIQIPIFALCLTLTLLTNFSEGGSNRASFNEPCGADTKCDSRASLVCQHGQCQCLKLDQMKFSEELGKCLVLAGKGCLSTIQTVTTFDHLNKSEIIEKKYGEMLSCVENAVCTLGGVCSCKPKYYKNSKGFCILKRSYGDTCANDGECMIEQYLVCDKKNLTCACNQTESAYDPKAGNKCVGLPTARCNNNLNELLSCHENAECGPDSICQCKAPHYYENSERLCVPKKGHGEACATNQECLETSRLSCLNGSCSCVQSNEVFDDNVGWKFCARRPGAVCDDKGPGCVAYAGCVVDRKCGWFKKCASYCECKDGYLPTKDGRCLGGHGSWCYRSHQCNYGLSCVNNACSCPFPELQVFDQERKVCTSLLGGPCMEEGENGTISKFDCEEEHSECKNVSEGLYECGCKDGFIKGRKRDSPSGSSPFHTHCYIAHGQYCGGARGSNCDPVAGLVCKNEKCLCPSLHFFDKTEQKCRGLVGAPCVIGKDSGQGQLQCVDGAFCKLRRYVQDEFPRLDGGYCRCKKGLVATPNRMCELGMGDSTVKLGNQQIN